MSHLLTLSAAYWLGRRCHPYGVTPMMSPLWCHPYDVTPIMSHLLTLSAAYWLGRRCHPYGVTPMMSPLWCHPYDVTPLMSHLYISLIDAFWLHENHRLGSTRWHHI